MIQHTLWWQTSGPALPINITYNLPPGTLMFITDQIGGSFLSLGPFVNQGTAIIPGTFANIFSKAFLKMQYNNIGGDPGGPVFGISSLSLNFPQIIVGSDTSLPVTVTNYGLSNTLTISNIVSSNSHFTISPNVFPINIAPMASEVFQITNTSASNAEQGTIQFTHNAYGSPTVIDYLQNAHGKTMAAPYSLRATDTATVSAPLSWDQLRHGVRPEDFNIRTMLSGNEDPWRGIFDTRQTIGR